MDSEWIEHHGKGHPDLPMDTLVQVRFADGGEALHPWMVVRWDVNWRHDVPNKHPCDITHYRVVTK